jgi:septum formation protein
MKKLILASQSPRRSEILKKAGYQFVSFPAYVSEIPNKNLSLNEQILDIAKRKAHAAATELLDKGLDILNTIILSADTMVCFRSEALGKPNDEAQAFNYLRLLSGQIHEVKTAICLLEIQTNEIVSHIETTQVHFHAITDAEINEYIKTKEPLDKAGAYAIQGIGGKFVKKYIGDYNNVVGLPLHEVEKLFTIKKWKFLKQQQEL